MAFPTTYEDSDADDEYERSVTSPPLVTDSETSPTDSDPPSTEHTPTTYGNLADDKLPRTNITEWTAEECADYVSSLGLVQYADAFLENEIVGEALIALRHDELKEMGMASVGHRLTLLKSVYEIKVKQDVPIDSEHYVPLSADAGAQDSIATQDDIARIIESIKLRDERIVQAEQELRKVTDEYRKLREELLPIFKMAKDMSQPLPFHPTASGKDVGNTEQIGIASQAYFDNPGGLSRKYSNKKLFLGSAPKNASPTHIPPSIQENRPFNNGSNVDPSAAAVAASTHLTASVSGGSQPSNSPGHPNIPSPTSPSSHNNPNSHNHLPSQSYNQQPPSNRPIFAQSEESLNPPPYSSLTAPMVDRSNPTPTPMITTRRGEGPHGEGPSISGPGGAPSVEIFKSFRVSMDDPCYKVLPAALKKYNLTADPKQYALYIVYGDEERCLEPEEKPLILFKQLYREGRKPMFMLRKNAVQIEAHIAGAPGSAGLSSQMGHLPNGRGPGYQSGGITVPGGVL